MEINEFIDTYSDDLITIHKARAAAYTHPLSGDYSFAEAYYDAPFCRILVVFVIGGIEAMLESWRDRDKFKVLEKYFATKDKDGQPITNGDRVTSLYQAFSDAGIQVDRQVFDDYLAMKYLRNTIIHGRWKDYEKEWLGARGFPTDTRKLKKEHLDKIENVNQNMMLYIALTGIAEPDAPKPAKLVKLEQATTRREEETGILRIRDIDRIIWMNLGRIGFHIKKDIYEAANSVRFDWKTGLSQAEVDALGNDDRDWLIYLTRLGNDDRDRLISIAARRAGEENYEPLAQHRGLANEALEFWREYWQRAVLSFVDEAGISHALELLENPDFARSASDEIWPSIIHNLPDDDARSVVDSALFTSAKFGSEQIVNAFKTGYHIYGAVPNFMPVMLFTVLLPIVDPVNTAAYLQVAAQALGALRLTRAWYSWAEDHCPPKGDSLAFWERMSREFAGRPSGA
jgi:hypothetical protein